MEEWVPLLGYPGYSVSNLGRIRNDKRDSMLSIIHTKSGHTYVGLMQHGCQVKRAVAKLVSDAFVPKPESQFFTTPIHLNGDLSDCHANNLLWRPRWFAKKFTVQFRIEQIKHEPVRDKTTLEVFKDCWPFVMKYGLLYLDIIVAIANNTYVFPTKNMFEWAK